MPDLAMLDYFYGDEAEQFTFYRIPKVLFTDPSYRRISSDAKILYGLMLDRMGLSVRNGWLDEYNRVFIFFTLEDALEYLCCGHTKAVALGGGVGVWGVVNLMEGYGADNPASKSQGVKQLMAGGGIMLLGLKVVPLLSSLITV